MDEGESAHEGEKRRRRDDVNLQEEEEEEEEEEKEECKRKVLQLLEEMRVFQSETVTAWREALTQCACMFNKCPPEGSEEQDPSATDFVLRELFHSVSADLDNVTLKLRTITSKLETEILQVSAGGGGGGGGGGEDSGEDVQEPSPPAKNPTQHLSHPQPSEREDEEEQEREEPEQNDCNHVKEAEEEVEVKGQVRDEGECPSEALKDTEKREVEDREDATGEWVTVGLTGTAENSQSHVPDACFVRTPLGAAAALSCDMADALSCLMVTGAEELVSRVVRVKVQDGASVRFPVTLVLPFCARYHGNYRDIAVKMMDGERRASYITPIMTEGTYAGQRGSFAEVRVYSLGLFAAVSCLRKENYTVPRRGLSLKLSMDPRICLSYPAGAFAAPVVAQTMIQPVDSALLATVKSRRDAYHAVASTSPLLYLTHPTSQPLRRPLTLTLPCPPNPEKKKRDARGRGKGAELNPNGSAAHRVRSLGASLTSRRDATGELLMVMGSRDKQWSVLENATVRSQQNGLVSLELKENCDRLLLVRLVSALSPPHLASLAEELEEWAGRHAVTVVLQRRHDDPHAALVAALPSRDLSWELSRLRAQGHGGITEASAHIWMSEGDQLLLRYGGNITSIRTRDGPDETLTFHTQRTSHLLLRLTEVDPFGNYSSAHYKGAAMFYKVTRGQRQRQGNQLVPFDVALAGEPVCSLSLTLPKKVRSLSRPATTTVKLCEETDSLPDSLLLWLASELSEEEVSLLVLSLRLRRSAALLVRLRAGDSASSRAFHLLAMWRRGLPAGPQHLQASQLAQGLAKSGRPDLARELLLRQAAGPGHNSLK